VSDPTTSHSYTVGFNPRTKTGATRTKHCSPNLLYLHKTLNSSQQSDISTVCPVYSNIQCFQTHEIQTPTSNRHLTSSHNIQAYGHSKSINYTEIKMQPSMHISTLSLPAILLALSSLNTVSALPANPTDKLHPGKTVPYHVSPLLPPPPLSLPHPPTRSLS